MFFFLYHRGLTCSVLAGMAFLCVWCVLFQSNFTQFLNARSSPKPCGIRCSGNDSLFLINTPGCSIPNFPLHEINVYRRSLPTMPACSLQPQLTEGRDLYLVFYKDRITHYNLTIDAVNCTYQAIGQKYRRPVLQEIVVIVEEKTLIVEEGILVYCVNTTLRNNTVFYRNVHFFVQPRTGRKKRDMFKEKFGSRSDHPEKLSVLVLGTDAVSRYNAIRHMPNTYHYVTEHLGALDFRGYNKIGENTLPNAYAIMFGHTDVEISAHACLPRNQYLDNCPIIWKDFDNEGYLTAFGEDVAPRGIFDYTHNGFVDNYVDLSPRNAFVGAGWIAHGVQGFSTTYGLCVGQQLKISLIHNYSLAVAEEFQDVPYFGFYWSSTVTHDSLTMPRVVDDHLLRLMTQFQDNGYLNHTVVLLVSDHGLRYGPFRHTYMGQIEERLPFLFAVFPPWFKKVYPVAWKNLVTNTRRLTSNLDIHETLHSLASGDFATNTKRPTEPGRGQSLFEEVPNTRSCSDVNISEFFCTCEVSMAISLDDLTVVAAAEVATWEINLSLKKFPDCVPLRLDKVLRARLVIPSKATQPYYKEHKVSTYILEFQTQPGGAMLEAMVRKQYKKFTLVGEALRTNRYGDQSHCINHSTLRKYCFCKDLLQPQDIGHNATLAYTRNNASHAG
ncbi:uncharacterized protein [Procambarus clarkii]|uniref:uncharacterized protein n=1 Tax=Procambarus clarkii TaxID=6728 RepID=UPI00374483A9